MYILAKIKILSQFIDVICELLLQWQSLFMFASCSQNIAAGDSIISLIVNRV